MAFAKNKPQTCRGAAGLRFVFSLCASGRRSIRQGLNRSEPDTQKYDAVTGEVEGNLPARDVPGGVHVDVAGPLGAGPVDDGVYRADGGRGVLLVLVYRQTLRLGGDGNYRNNSAPGNGLDLLHRHKV